MINVAVAPILARFERLDDRMPGCDEVLRGVLILARVAAADVSAATAQSQMHPRIACLQTLLAAMRARRDIADLV